MTDNGTGKPKRAPSLEAIGMTKTFGHFTALGDVSLRVEAGSFHALRRVAHQIQNELLQLV